MESRPQHYRPQKPSIQLTKTPALSFRLIAGTNYLAYVLELISTASRGVSITFGNRFELPYMRPNSNYVEANALYTKRKKRSGGRFLSRAGTALGVPTNEEQWPDSIVVVTRMREAKVQAFEEKHTSGVRRSRQMRHSYFIFYMDISRLSKFVNELSPFGVDWPTMDFCYLALTSKLCFRFIDWGSVARSLVQFGYESVHRRSDAQGDYRQTFLRGPSLVLRVPRRTAFPLEPDRQRGRRPGAREEVSLGVRRRIHLWRLGRVGVVGIFLIGFLAKVDGGRR